ncbi:MAG: glycosyl hydrolase family 28-related protein, partial [Planctomycetota bacterium]
MMHALFARALGFGFATVALSGASQVSPAWQSYAANPDAHPTIPNVAYAGYNSGIGPLPTVNDGRAIVNVSTFGAVAGDANDDTQAIRDALAAARGFATIDPDGVAVVFDAGEYIVSGPLFVHSSNTILAGAGQQQTTLRFTESLTSSHAEYTSWGFSGGMIWFVAEDRETYRQGVPTITGLDVFWSTGSPSSGFAAGAQLGDRSVTVSNAGQFAPGDYVFVQMDNATDLSTLRHLFGDGVWANTYPFNPVMDGKILPQSRSVFRSVHRIESIAGNTVMFEEPLKHDARVEWNPQLRTPQRVLRNVGIRDMTLRFDRSYEWTISVHNDEPGYNGVCMNAVINGFIENVSFRNTDGLAVNLNSTKHVTVRNTDIGADSAVLRPMHHAYVIANSFDVLVQDFVIDARPLHGLYMGNVSMGCVYSRGVVADGTFDYHKILPYSNAYTEIMINNSGSAGGASDSGPRMGARHAHWNIDTLNSSGTIIAQPDIMPKGTLVGVRCVPLGPTVNPIAGESEALIENSGRFASAPIPGNLHDAQVALRLSQPIDITPGDSCNNCGPDAVYVFAGASQIGQDLDGQDNWVLARDFSGFGTIATLSVDNSFPDGPAVVPIGIQGRDGIYSRQNNADFAFTPFASGATNAEIYFSLRSGGSSGSGDALLIVNNADQDGVQFGISNNNTVTLRGGRFSQVLRETV